MKHTEVIVAQYLPIDSRPFPEGCYRCSTPDGHGTINCIKIPDEYLPPTRPDQSDKRRYWFKNELIYLMAHLSLLNTNYDPNFLWCIESDCYASKETWNKLLDDTKDCDADFIGVRQKYRKEINGKECWGMWNSAPTKYDKAFVGSIFRLSKKAIEVLLKNLKINSTIFCEISVPSTIHLSGLKILDLKTISQTYHKGTIIGKLEQNKRDEQHIWHPVKTFITK